MKTRTRMALVAMTLMMGLALQAQGNDVLRHIEYDDSTYMCNKLSRLISPNYPHGLVQRVTAENRNPAVKGEVSNGSFCSFITLNQYSQGIVAFYLQQQRLLPGVYDIAVVVVPENINDTANKSAQHNKFSATLLSESSDGSTKEVSQLGPTEPFQSDPTRVDTIRLFENMTLDGSSYILRLESQKKLIDRDVTTSLHLDCILLTCKSTDQSQVVTADGMTFFCDTDRKEALLADATSCSGEVTVPATVKLDETEYTVTGIATEAFSGCNRVTAVTLPETVTQINYAAFAGCTGMKSITLTDAITTIRGYAFQGCTGLESIVLPKGTTEVETSLFAGCTNLKDITLPQTITTIKEYAFSGCAALETVTVPDRLTTIEKGAFYGCSSLKRIDLPKTITSIGEDAFGSCSSLADVYAYRTKPNAYQCHISAFKKSSITTCCLHVAPGEKVRYNELPWSDFGYYKEDISIENVLVYKTDDNLMTATLVQGAEYYVGNIVIPETVTIGDNTYRVTGIGDKAFAGCMGLQSLVIGKNVEYIGVEAFQSTPVKHVTLAEDNTSFICIDGVIYDKDTTTIYYVDREKEGAFTLPNTVARIMNYAFNTCEQLTDIIFPEKMTLIAEYAFKGCTGLKFITMPLDVEKWAYNTIFEGCTGMTGITLPSQCNIKTKLGMNLDMFTSLKDVYTMGCYASYGSLMKPADFKPATVHVTKGSNQYSNNHGVKVDLDVQSPLTFAVLSEESRTAQVVACPKNQTGEIIIPAITVINQKTYWVTEVSDGAFADCQQLDGVKFSEYIKRIGNQAFRGCTRICYLHLPANIQEIGNGAFNGCTGLSYIYNPSITPQTITETTFSNYNAQLRIPVESQPDYASANGWKNFHLLAEKDTLPLTNHRIFDWGITSDWKSYPISSIITGYSWLPYLYLSYHLNETSAPYHLFVPTDSALKRYYDPTSDAVIEFTYNEKGSYDTRIKANSYTYDRLTGEVGETPTPVKQNIIVNHMRHILQDHLVEGINQDIYNGNEFFLSRSGAPVHITPAMRIQGGRQVEEGTEINLIPSNCKSRYGNGQDHAIDQPLQSATKSIYAILHDNDNEDSPYREFMKLCEPDMDVCNEIGTADNWTVFSANYTYKNSLSYVAMDFNVGCLFPFQTNNYTVYVPTNESLREAIDKGLPTWENIAKYIKERKQYIADNAAALSLQQVDSLTADYRAQARAKANYLLLFVKNHFQQHSVFADNLPADKQTYPTATINPLSGEPTLLNVWSEGNKTLYVADTNGEVRHVNTDGGHFNLLACELWKYIIPQGENTSYITSSAYAVVHQIDGVLNFAPLHEGRYDNINDVEGVKTASSDGQSLMDIYDLHGQHLYHGPKRTLNLPKGIYIINGEKVKF